MLVQTDGELHGTTRSVLPAAGSGLYWTRFSSTHVAYLHGPASLGLVHWIVDDLPSGHVVWGRIHLGDVASAANQVMAPHYARENDGKAHAGSFRS